MRGICFWDWNGTLLDDARYAMAVRNRCFPRFGLPKLTDMATYREQFTFPVSEYYRRAGVTDEQFVTVADAWMEEYIRNEQGLKLRRGAQRAVTALHQAGVTQVILSASKLASLQTQLSRYPIAGLFERLLGLEHIYATSKEEIGRAFLAQSGEKPEDCLMIGDTTHDAQVASAMGVNCLLVTGGHQSEQALLATGCTVLKGLRDAEHAALVFFSSKE